MASETGITSGLTAEQLASVAERVQGTCDTLTSACEALDIAEPDLSDLEADLEQHFGLVICPGCDWWVEVSELDDDGYCPQCQEERSGRDAEEAEELADSLRWGE
jgi:hypothetical protein